MILDRRFVLTCLLITPVLATGAQDQEARRVELDPIVVVASKAPRPLSSVAGQVSVIEAGDIDAALAENMDDLFRYEPGVDAETSGTRFGLGGINIRGIGGNRVAMEVDGVPVPKGFAVGSYSHAGRALLDTDRIKRLEVLHGPASSLYGSDALGGVLAFTTWDPDDLTARGDGQRYLGLRGGFRDADDSQVMSGLGALTGGPHGLLLSATLRAGHETESAAAGDAARDPQAWDSADYAARYTLDTAGGNRLRLSAEQFSVDTQTQVGSLLGNGRFRSTTSLRGDDRDEHRQYLADFTFSGDFPDQGVLRVFRTEAETRNLTFEERAAAAVPARYERFFRFQTALSGAEFNGFHELSSNHGTHRLGAGIDILRTTVSELRDGFQQEIGTGAISHTILGETMPVRDFPNSTTHEWGLFIQDEINLAGGDWEVIPALRYTRYQLNPASDPVYAEDYPGTPLVDIDLDDVSPRLALMYHFSDEWSAYGQYVEGFRAPPVQDANIGFEIALFRFRAIPNPDLESETSRGYELGIRRFSAGSSLSLTWFDTDYENFIESRALIGLDPASGYLIFQSRNIGQARIYGLDARLNQDLGGWNEKLDGLLLSVAAYWSRGDNLDNGEPLNSILAPQAVVGLGWSSRDARWRAGLAATFTAAKERIDETGGERFATPGYGLLDLTAGWRINRRLSIAAGIYNLTDKTYWRWTDVANLAADDPMIPLLARPGRNYAMSARLEW